MSMSAVSYTAGELAERGLDGLPKEMVSSRHMIYSSPATLAYNSPGAEGFGVKRAGLAVPGSVMLLVSPGCCGRNTTLTARMPQYRGRFFYYVMDDTDIVTGRHLNRIPEAVCEVCASLREKPSVVMICITCVDALLGTDMERVCRRAEEAAGVPVRPCYMYALTREGRKPPMVHVRQSLYSLLEPRPKKPSSVNLLGFFAPLRKDCELYELLRGIGVKRIREISTCTDYGDYLSMAEANFNLVLNPEARLAADDLGARLGIPSIELTRRCHADAIRRQYRALGAALGVAFDDAALYEQADAAVSDFRRRFGPLHFSLGECMNADPFELALSLARYGFCVDEIYGTLQSENFVYLRRFAELSPETKVYSNMEPTMLYYDSHGTRSDVTIGKDAGWYHRECPNLPWNHDVQPFGYRGLQAMLSGLAAVLEERA